MSEKLPILPILAMGLSVMSCVHRGSTAAPHADDIILELESAKVCSNAPHDCIEISFSHPIPNKLALNVTDFRISTGYTEREGGDNLYYSYYTVEYFLSRQSQFEEGSAGSPLSIPEAVTVREIQVVGGRARLRLTGSISAMCESVAPDLVGNEGNENAEEYDAPPAAFLNLHYTGSEDAKNHVIVKEFGQPWADSEASLMMLLFTTEQRRASPPPIQIECGGELARLRKEIGRLREENQRLRTNLQGMQWQIENPICPETLQCSTDSDSP